MNPLAKILVYVIGVVLVAALLSPPIFWICNAIADAGWIPSLAKYPFFRYFSRIVQIAALVFLVPVIWWLRVRSWSELGIERNPGRLRDLGFGLAAAIVPLAVMGSVYFAYDVYRVRDEIAWAGMARIGATATFVSVFEEVLFRGVLLGLAIRQLGRGAGITVITVIFSVIHFLKPRAAIAREDVTWLSGFQLIGSALESDTAGILVFSGCVTLIVIGLILAWTAVKTQSLWLAIGLHAGWILGQQTMNLIGKYRVKPPEELMPWLGPNLVSGMVPTGVVPLVALLATAGLVWWHLGRAKPARVDSVAGSAG